MLISASDYKYQPVGNYDVTQTPVYALSPVDRPLLYSDLLYLCEAYQCLTVTRGQSALSAYNLPYGDDLSMKVTSYLSQGMSPPLLLSFIRSLYNNGTQSAISGSGSGVYYKSSASFAGYKSYNTNASILDISSFRSDFALPDLTSQTDFAPDKTGDPFAIEKYLRAWNAVAQMRRMFYGASDLSISGSATTTYYTNGSGSTPVVTPISATSGINYTGGSAYEFGKSRRQGEDDEYDIYETLRESSCTVTIPSKPSFLSFTINGVIAEVDGGHKTTSTGEYSRPSVYYFSKSVTSGSSFNLSFTPQEAQGYASLLGVDTSYPYWFVSVSPRYLDITFSFRHDI